MRLAALLCAASLGAASLVPLDEAAYRSAIAGNKGKVVLVDFWATWCGPCRAELPELVKIERRMRSRGFVLVTVSADEPEQETSALQFALQTGVRPPAYLKRVRNDEDFINSVDRQWSGALPALFLYDRTGHRVASFIGETQTADVERAIGKLL